MSDVVSRLLAAIDEREQKARNVTGSVGRWTYESDPTDEVVVRDEDGEQRCWPRGDGHGEHIAANDPTAVLRLCQAHRDIADERQKAAMHYRWAQAAAAGGVARAADQLAVWDHAVRIVARGYGVEDGETK